MIVGSMQVSASAPPTRARHVVLWMTVAVYMITYMDRVVLSATTTDMRKELGFDLITMSYIVAAFRWSYALFQVPGGLLGDRVGPRKALTWIVIWWSAFTSLTALAWSSTVMIAVRFLFGVGEAGAFPIATRSLSRWMLATERGFAQGVTHAGSRLGSALTPPLVAYLILHFGWRMPFFVFGALGIVWAISWYVYYRNTPEEHAGVNAAELDLIHAGGAVRKSATGSVPWGKILSSPTLWFLCLMYFCYNYSLSVYVDWFPTYLRESRNMTLAQMGIYASLPLLAGTAGDLLGGWCSDIVLKRTRNVNLARRWVAIAGFLACAAATVPAALTKDVQTSVAFYSLAFFSLEWTVGISWAVPLDIGGDFAGSVSAFMNMCGNIGGAISATVLGYMVGAFGWDVPFLVTSGLCGLAAVLYLKIDATKSIV
ncbi:MAG: MFS transporter [Acidobacteriota bacterium]